MGRKFLVFKGKCIIMRYKTPWILEISDKLQTQTYVKNTTEGVTKLNERTVATGISCSYLADTISFAADSLKKFTELLVNWTTSGDCVCFQANILWKQEVNLVFEVFIASITTICMLNLIILDCVKSR